MPQIIPGIPEFVPGDPPSIPERINYVVRFVQNPCDAPWHVYAELAGPPAGDAVIALLTFGMDDVARGYFRPRTARRAGHLRGRRGGRGRFGIPELGEATGRRIPGAEFFRGRTAGPIESVLWQIDGVIQRGLWYWLVADVTTEFAYEWTSAVNESIFCQFSQALRISLNATTEGFVVAVPSPPWSDQEIVFNNGLIPTLAGASGFTDDTFFVAGSANYRSGTTPPTPVNVEQEIIDGSGNQLAVNSIVDGDPDRVHGLITTATLTRGGSARLRARTTDGGVAIGTNGNFWGQQEVEGNPINP